MMNVKEMVINNKQVEFVKFDSDNLWYKAENGFEFAVPVSDIGASTFIPKDKAILFMRWIKKQLDTGVVSQTINSIVDGEEVNFIRYQHGDLWYNSKGFDFPIAIKEIEGDVFDKIIGIKKADTWIKKHLANIEEGKINNS